MNIRERMMITDLDKFDLSKSKLCPNDETKLRFVSARMDFAYGVEIMDYVMDCPECGYVFKIRKKKGLY